MESSALRPLSLPQDLWSRGTCLPTGSKGRDLQANGFAQGQASSPEEANGGQEDGRTEDVGAAVVAGYNGPPVLLSGKERLDVVTLAIRTLAVMHWFPAAATGRDARRDARLDKHLTDFVPITVAAGGRSLRTPSALVKSLHCPSLRWSRRRPPLLPQTPLELAGHAPLC